jgi:hypothetical protein
VATSKLGQYAKAQALAAVFRQAQSPATGSVYLGLATAAVDETNLTVAAVTEYVPTGYARQTFAVGAPTAASPSVISNSGTITFGPFTAGTGSTVTHWFVCDASTGTAANIIACGALTTSRTPAVGDSLQAAAASFTASLA